ncbi:MAG: sugar/nucleoside kinase (ribokinase family) [Verrucomicrobiales bacterium]|jgi:sugar/nucleoside kinase (ribokinase family)
MNVLVAGTVALDNVKTPSAYREDLMGGSAAYAAIAASFFSPVRLVSIVGKDFPKQHIDTLKARDICTDGIEVSDGESFRWSGEYHEDMNDRTTHSVAINVLEAFDPKLPERYLDSDVIVLGNMSPKNQLDVIRQVKEDAYIIADTMDIWIQAAHAELIEVLNKVDLLVLNDSEAKLFMETNNIIVAGKKLLEMGPKHVVIKTGEHGALLFGIGGEFFRCGAYPLDVVEDPTGAGDCFLGGFAGHLASLKRLPEFADLRRACIHGTIMASFNCQSFSTERLSALTQADIDARFEEFKGFTHFD